MTDALGLGRRMRGMFGGNLRDRGDAARDRGDWIAAKRAYQDHLDAHPDDGAIWVQLGHMSKESGQFDEALSAYSRAQQAIGDDADLQLNIGHLLKLMGRIDQAYAAYRGSAALAPALFGGEAMIQMERIRGRLLWCVYMGEELITPDSVAALTEAVEIAEASGRQTLFASYFRSYELR